MRRTIAIVLALGSAAAAVQVARTRGALAVAQQPPATNRPRVTPTPPSRPKPADLVLDLAATAAPRQTDDRTLLVMRI